MTTTRSHLGRSLSMCLVCMCTLSMCLFSCSHTYFGMGSAYFSYQLWNSYHCSRFRRHMQFSSLKASSKTIVFTSMEVQKRKSVWIGSRARKLRQPLHYYVYRRAIRSDTGMVGDMTCQVSHLSRRAARGYSACMRLLECG